LGDDTPGLRAHQDPEDTGKIIVFATPYEKIFRCMPCACPATVLIVFESMTQFAKFDARWDELILNIPIGF
jgi:hypothetical protein